MSRIYSAVIGGGGANTILVDRRVALTQGQTVQAISFPSDVGTSTYSVKFSIENSVDKDTLQFLQGVLSDPTSTGFNLELNIAPNSGNYYLNYQVAQLV